MKDRIKKNSILLICILIAVILTMIILSITLSASTKVPVTKLSQVQGTGDFARYIAYNPKEFINLSASSIFGLKNLPEPDMVGRLASEPTYEPLMDSDSSHKASEIWYVSCLCLYHTQSNLEWIRPKIVNVIDINTNGTFTVYNGANSSKTVTLTDTNQKKSMSAFAYLLYKSTIYERVQTNGSWPGTGSFTATNLDNIDASHRRYNTGTISGVYTDLWKLKSTIGSVYNYKFNNDKNLKVVKILRDNVGTFLDDVFTGTAANTKYNTYDDDPYEPYLSEAINVANTCSTAHTLEKMTTNPTVEYVGNNAYIGPFAVKYSGGNTSIYIGNTKCNWARKNSTGFGATETGNLPVSTSSGNLQTFYVVLNANTAKNLNAIDVKVTLSYESYKARVVFSNNVNGGGQNLMYYAGMKDTGSTSIDWKVEQNKDLTIQKVDENGSNISKEGITFEVYNSSGTKVGTLKTDANGKTETLTLKHGQEYTIKETVNNLYGYEGSIIKEVSIASGSGTVSVSNGEAKVSLTLDSTIAIKNSPELGNIKPEKCDVINSNIKLENVGFALEISPSPKKTHAYIQLRDKDEKIVKEIKGTATINSKNKANADGTEYSVKYYCTDKTISEMTQNERDSLMSNITTFITGADGTLTVNNLEVYHKKGSKYTYKLIETTNSNYGYEAKFQEFANIQLQSNETAERKLGNNQTFTKLSGYVWVENSQSKGNDYDGVYTEDTNDVKLTDLYINEDGVLKVNTSANVPVQIKLRNKNTGKIVKEQPDEFSSEGEYKFNDVKIHELANLEVVFVYNGFYYTTIAEQLNVDNGSKVAEIATERTKLNNKFATVKDNNEVVSKEGNTNKVEYSKNGHTSTVSKLNFDTTISATTNEAQYNLSAEFAKAKKENQTELTNVNMGIVLREQPKLAVGNDIYSVYVDVNNKGYTYYYNGRQNHYENINNDVVGAKFEQEYAKNRYTRPVYSSDVEALENGNATMSVSITYKITLINQSNTLTSVVNEIQNYFDSRYTITAIGASYEDVNKAESERTSNYEVIGEENIDIDEAEGIYKAARIKLNNGVEIQAGGHADVYIKFEVSQEAIKGLLRGKSTYHNATEIMSYSTYYGERTNKITDAEEYFTTDKTTAINSDGAKNLYAGIDKSSQPGNIKLKLIPYDSSEESEEDTKVLDTTNFEDDTASAPSLVLVQTDARTISGTIFEDATPEETTANSERLGNGIFDEGEKVISGIKVELWEVDDSGKLTEIATYSNGEQVIATTGEDGNYTFGYQKEDGEYVGVLPGRYVIKYTYNNESYIVGKENINVNNYKSTIITSEAVKNGFENSNERWFAIEENNRYSDARDDINLRPEYNNEIDKTDLSVTNLTYETTLKKELMEATTPVMNIGIEFTEEDAKNEEDTLSPTRKIELNNVDFGIVERPRVYIEVDKNITGLEIVAQNGTSIIPKGDPSNQSMQYVKNLEDVVYAEVESDLLQSAELRLEYTITVENNSEKDYLSESYYYYGKANEEDSEIIPEVKKVVDYMDVTMFLTEETENSVWQKVEKLEDLNGLVSEGKDGQTATKEELETGNYSIYVTTEFEGLGAGSAKTVKLYASRVLSTSSTIKETNRTEILEISGVRAILDSIPGDLVPGDNNSDDDTVGSPDQDIVKLIITPPTGTTVNYILYIIAAIATGAILVLGIVFVKKKVIKK